MWCEVKSKVNLFAYGYPIFPALFVQEVFLFSIELLCLLYLNTIDSISDLYTVPFIFMSIFTAIPDNLNYYNYIVTLKISQCKSSSYRLFQNCFDNLDNLYFHINFIYLFIYLLAVPQGLQDLSSQMRN